MLSTTISWWYYDRTDLHFVFMECYPTWLLRKGQNPDYDNLGSNANPGNFHILILKVKIMSVWSIICDLSCFPLNYYLDQIPSLLSFWFYIEFLTQTMLNGDKQNNASKCQIVLAITRSLDRSMEHFFLQCPEESNPAEHWFQTSDCQNYEKIKFSLF